MKTIPQIKSDYMNDVIDYQTAKNQLYLYSRTAQAEIENVMILWKLKKDKPEVNNLLNELADLRSKDNLTVDEKCYLMAFIRMGFDKTKNTDSCNTVISGCEKIGLPEYFINEMKNDLKVK